MSENKENVDPKEVAKLEARADLQKRAEESRLGSEKAGDTAQRVARTALSKDRKAQEAVRVSGIRKNKLDTTREIGTNALALPWPQDPAGALSKLKAGGVEAAKRVNGDKAKLARLLKTLEVISGHAKARYKMDTASRAKAKENHLSARVRSTEARLASAEAKAAEYEKAAQRVRTNAGIKKEGK